MSEMNDVTRHHLESRALGLAMQIHTQLNGDWTGIEAFNELKSYLDDWAHATPVRFSLLEQQSLRALHDRVVEDSQNIFAELVSAFKLGRNT